MLTQGTRRNRDNNTRQDNRGWPATGWVRVSYVMWAFVLGVTVMAPVAAQTDASRENQRAQERQRALREQQEVQPDVRLQKKNDTEITSIPENESPCFKITEIALHGKQAAHFAFALSSVTKDDVLGRCLGTRGINAVMSRIQDAIIARGYVTTRIVAQSQDLKSGKLALTVIPGHVRKIVFAKGTDESRATKWNAVPVNEGDLLNLRDIEQGLENFKRVPTADADIQITPGTDQGAEPGDSDLVISYRQGFPFRISASVDDSGMKATGKYQAHLTIAYDNWWTLNDLFYVSATRDIGGGHGDNGTNGSTVHYSLPLGYWQVGVTLNNSGYRQVVPFIQNMNNVYTGRTEDVEMKLSRLIYRDAVRKTTVGFRVFTRSSRNFLLDEEIALQRNQTAGWGMDVSHREYLGSSVLDVSMAYKRGTGALRALPAAEGTSRFRLYTADATWHAPFTVEMPWGKQGMRYQLATRGQWSQAMLSSSERFSIGGRYTVRGFDGEMMLTADRGLLVRNELGMSLGSSGQEIYVGIDHGEVGGKSAQFLAGRRLTGGVVGMRGSLKILTYDVFAGAPIYKPAALHTARVSAGFNLNVSY